jgi:hypothetical protein
MAPDTEVLLVARKAALPVSFSHEPMAQSPPGVRVVARRLRVVTRNAIRFFMTGQTVVAQRSCGIHRRFNGSAMVFNPVCGRRLRAGKRDFACHGSLAAIGGGPSGQKESEQDDRNHPKADDACNAHRATAS